MLCSTKSKESKSAIIDIIRDLVVHPSVPVRAGISQVNKNMMDLNKLLTHASLSR